MKPRRRLRTVYTKAYCLGQLCILLQIYKNWYKAKSFQHEGTVYAATNLNSATTTRALHAAINQNVIAEILFTINGIDVY